MSAAIGKPAGRVPLVLLAAGLVLALLATGCSRQKLVVYMTAPLIETSLDETFASADLQTVEEALPGEILLLRGLCGSDPGNRDLWTTTVQLYASFALLFVGPEDPQWAEDLYREGKDLGLRFLKREEWFAEAWNAGPDRLREVLRERRPERLAPLCAWTAACLGEYILMNQDRPAEMLDLPYVHVLLDTAIELDPGYFHGLPYAMKGVMLATVPQGLGGNLVDANRYFEQAIAVSGGKFLLFRVFRARYYLAGALDQEGFVQALQEVLATPVDLAPEIRLVNQLARRRAVSLLAEQDELF